MSNKDTENQTPEEEEEEKGLTEQIENIDKKNPYELKILKEKFLSYWNKLALINIVLACFLCIFMILCIMLSTWDIYLREYGYVQLGGVTFLSYIGIALMSGYFYHKEDKFSYSTKTLFICIIVLIIACGWSIWTFMWIKSIITISRCQSFTNVTTVLPTLSWVGDSYAICPQPTWGLFITTFVFNNIAMVAMSICLMICFAWLIKFDNILLITAHQAFNIMHKTGKYINKKRVESSISHQDKFTFDKSRGYFHKRNPEDREDREFIKCHFPTYHENPETYDYVINKSLF